MKKNQLLKTRKSGPHLSFTIIQHIPVPPIPQLNNSSHQPSSIAAANMAGELEILTNIGQALQVLMEMVGSIGRLALAFLGDLVTTSWNFTSKAKSNENVRAAAGEGETKTASAPTSPNVSMENTNKSLAEDETQKQEPSADAGNTKIVEGEAPAPDSAEAPAGTDTFWNINTLPTSRHPEVPAALHAPKYSPDYDTLAGLDNDKIFPQSQ